MQLFNSVKKALDLVLIIDRSGSMAGTERGIIKGHQKIIDTLRKTGKNVTLNARPSGTTALFDAWGASINHINERKKDKNNFYPSADVLYLTVTDGEENSSSVFDTTKIRNLMMRERERSIEEKSDKLKIGSYTLGQLKKMTKEPEKVLTSMEKTYMELLRIAENGLTKEFLAAYTKYCKDLEKSKPRKPLISMLKLNVSF